MLQPLTLIPNYKLKMNVLSLQHHWRPVLTDVLNKEKFIDKATGYDGSLEMVQKAKKTYPGSEFFKMDLNNWNPKQTFDITAQTGGWGFAGAVAAGMIAGEALMGVLVAVFIIAWKPPWEWFSFMGTLGPALSVAFFLWFFGVFTWLATRQLPPGGGPFSLLMDWVRVAVDGGRRLVKAVLVPSNE